MAVKCFFAFPQVYSNKKLGSEGDSQLRSHFLHYFPFYQQEKIILQFILSLDGVSLRCGVFLWQYSVFLHSLWCIATKTRLCRWQPSLQAHFLWSPSEPSFRCYTPEGYKLSGTKDTNFLLIPNNSIKSGNNPMKD